VMCEMKVSAAEPRAPPGPLKCSPPGSGKRSAQIISVEEKIWTDKLYRVRAEMPAGLPHPQSR
jgi:hypothetical protein